ncbi:hypothetical protein [Legionella pneumophila]|uniref:hypothetical protein n=1 Tax=Legionella pneumophila TaxID=446 RepID=UPI002494B4FE|nr:hypothetical protein [Legionella pneumophila]
MAYAELIVEEARKAKLRGETLGNSKTDVLLLTLPLRTEKNHDCPGIFCSGRDDEASDAKNYQNIMNKAGMLS